MRPPRRQLTPAWVAGALRARLLIEQAIGPSGARDLATSGSLAESVRRLVGSAYGRSVRGSMDLATTQRAIADVVLWRLRVLAGWLPPGGGPTMRALAFWFDIANVEDRLAYLAGGPVPRPFELGGLGTLRGAALGATSVEQLAASIAGATGEHPTDANALRIRLRFAWARQVIETVPEAHEWAQGAVALLVAREQLLAGRSAEQLAAERPPLSPAWRTATDLRGLRAALPAEADWPLASVSEPHRLWEGEVAWRRRVESDADALIHTPELGRRTVVGAAVLSAIDGWRVSAALEAATRGSDDEAVELFDALAG